MIASIFNPVTGRILSEVRCAEGEIVDPLAHRPNDPDVQVIYTPDGLDFGADSAWVMAGARVSRSDLPAAKLTFDGLTAILSPGHVFGERHGELAQSDSYTFSSPAFATAVALDLVTDVVTGALDLQAYAWSPGLDRPPLPAGVAAVKTDLLRGLLPARATGLDQLQVEEV